VMAVPQASGLQRQARYAAALSLIDLRRHDEAFRTLRDLLKLQPAAAVANALGVIQLRRTPTAQTGQPTYYLSQAVELDPDNADLYFNLGYAYWRARDAQGSAYWLREAVRRNPADAEAHFVLGSAVQQLGATVEGQREQALARQLSGDVDRWSTGVPSGLERLSTTLKGVRRRGQALDAPASAAERTSLARFHLDAGRRAFERGDDREALSALRRATFLSPYLAEAHLLLGRPEGRTLQRQNPFAWSRARRTHHQGQLGLSIDGDSGVLAPRAGPLAHTEFVSGRVRITRRNPHHFDVEGAPGAATVPE